MYTRADEGLADAILPGKKKDRNDSFLLQFLHCLSPVFKLIYHILFRPAIRFENENIKSQNIVIFYQRIAGFPKKVVLRC